MILLLFSLLQVCLTSSIVLAACVQREDDSLQAESGLDSISAIEKIQKDYAEFTGKSKLIAKEYESVLTTLRDTEADFQKIQVDAVKQQMSAMQSSLQSLEYQNQTYEYIQRFNDGANPVQGKRPNARTGGKIARDSVRTLIDAKAKADLAVASRAIELQQLSAAQQALVRRRIETIQKGHTLQQEWIEWHADWPKFMDRYWPYSDPERRMTHSQVQACLDALAKADAEDIPAMITSAMLLERIGKHDEALAMIDKALAIKTSLETTGMLAKVSILYSLGKTKEAKASLLVIHKSLVNVPLLSQQPIDRWLKARIAASQKQYPQAEAEWKSLVNHKPMELEARRALAMLSFVRADRSPIEGKKASKEAQLAMDLEPRADWFSHFVLGAAMHAAEQGKEALKELTEAEKTATEENLELCSRLRKHIQDGEAFEWDFVHASSTNTADAEKPDR
jgi:tetratricopeptide (TPR) repeat protein